MAGPPRPWLEVLDAESALRDPVDAAQPGITIAARRLARDERDGGYRYLPIDDESLREVRKRYESLMDSPARRAEPVLDFMFAVRDMLNLADPPTTEDT